MSCTFDGVRYIPCEAIKKAGIGINGHFKGLSFLDLGNLQTGEEYYGGLIYRYGKKKEDIRLCNYCPACGVKITKEIGA